MSKYSDPLPAFVDCQKDSESTGESGTQVKPVLLAVEIFAVHTIINPNTVNTFQKNPGMVRKKLQDYFLESKFLKSFHIKS